ncbi:MAG: hypothetical protein U0514_01095 [Candidatus Andersenbacteria bacterium]
MTTQHASTTVKRARPFTIAVIFFVAASSLALALSDYAGLNVVRYYPALSVFATRALPGQIEAGLSGSLLTAMLFGFIAVAIYLIILPIIRWFDLLHTAHAMVVANAALWVSVALIVVQEWRRWVVPIPSPGLFNDTFWLLFAALLLFLFGLLFNSGFEHRVAHLVRRAESSYRGRNDHRERTR